MVSRWANHFHGGCVKLVADALEEDRHATCEELSGVTGAKTLQENAQELTSFSMTMVTCTSWMQIHCNYSRSHASRGQRGVRVLRMVGHCHATSQIGTSLLAATWQRRSVALKPVMPSSLATARAFNWHISLVTAHLYCLLSSTQLHSLSSSFGCLAFWPWNAQHLLFVSVSRVLFFATVTNTTFTHIILSSLCTISKVFCLFNYPKLFFCLNER